MKGTNKVFIATSLDGFIADKDGGIDWLHSIPNPEGNDMGYNNFMKSVDALLMGRNTFETVCSFDMEWPYEKPVFVLSNTLKKVPKGLEQKAFPVSGPLREVLDQIHTKGYHNLYIDGGKTIQNFLKEDLIDEIILTRIPVLLGEGIPLFGALEKPLHFACLDTKIYLKKVVQSRFIRENV